LRTHANPNGIPFGAHTKDTNIVDVVGRLKTYTEQAHTDTVAKIKDKIGSAHTVVFLGFGFHEPNMLLLSASGKSSAHKVLATAKGVSGSDRAIVQNSLQAITNKNLESQDLIVRDFTCAELFQEYRFTLQAA
jgi:hypothetical protein